MMLWMYGLRVWKGVEVLRFIFCMCLDSLMVMCMVILLLVSELLCSRVCW